MKIGEQLQKQRKLHNMSQNELADKLHLTRQSISKWENSTTLPSFANVIAISELFDVSLDELIKGDERLMDKFKNNDDKIKLTGVEKIIWGGIGAGILAWIALKLFRISDSLIDVGTLIIGLISVIGLLKNLNWKYVNRSLNKKAVIFGIILLAIFIIGELISFINGMRSGMNDYVPLYKY